MLLYYAFLLVRHITFSFSFFASSLYLFNFSYSFPLITPCPLSFTIWYPFFPQSLHVKYETTTSLLIYPNSNRSASLGTPSPQYSNALYHRVFSELLLYSSYYTFCRITICAVLFFSNLLFGQLLSTSMSYPLTLKTSHLVLLCIFPYGVYWILLWLHFLWYYYPHYFFFFSFFFVQKFIM